MKLIGKLKKEVDNIESREGRRDAIRKAGMLLTDDELDMVGGGAGDDGSGYIIDGVYNDTGEDDGEDHFRPGVK